MRHIGGIYTQRYNRLRKSDGPLFRGRYKAILVDHDAYLLHLSKYIHRNPLEAKMINGLVSYPWSSYPSYIDEATPPAWLYREEVYGQLNAIRGLAKRYQQYVLDTTIDPELEAFYDRERLGPVLGDEDFIEGLKDKLGVPLDEGNQEVNQK